MAGDDVIRIDIEVSTQAKKEIDDILNDITSGESKLSQIKERSRKRKRLSSGGAPTDIDFGEQEERGGIFGGQLFGEAKPEKPRDTKSREPVQRENIIKQLEERQSTMEKLMGVTSKTGAGLAILKGGNDPIQTVFTLLRNIPGFVQVMAAALIAKGIMDFIIEELFRDGGIFDRRFLRKLDKEVSNITSRKEKAQINAGKRIIISSTRQGLRGGQGQFTSTVSFINRGGVYDPTLETISKGVP